MCPSETTSSTVDSLSDHILVVYYDAIKHLTLTALLDQTYCCFGTVK